MYQISLDYDEIRLDLKELRKRLGGQEAGELLGDRLPVFINEVKKSLSPKAALRKVPVIADSDGVNLGFGTIKSSNLVRNLKGCEEAYLLCVTLGAACDRLLRRAEIESVMKQYLMDALLSSYVESICDAIQMEIEREEKLRPRFAPGYGDFSLNWQRKFLSHAGGNEIGIDLTESGLMMPTKSITAVMGIEHE